VGDALAIEVELEDLSAAGVPVAVGGTAAEQAAAVVARADAEARRLQAHAAEQGREEGFAAGMAAAHAELEPLRQALLGAVQEVYGAREQLAAVLELRAAELAVRIAEKVIGATLDVAPEAVLSVVSAALRRVLVRDRLVLEVSPADFALVRDHVAELTEHLGGFHRVEVVAERRVGRGGCVVRTVEGEIDATVESQLERVQELLVAAGRSGSQTGDDARDPAER
jgi:flagellar biosynthesis/type III secretory pathway protein FliH